MCGALPTRGDGQATHGCARRLCQQRQQRWRHARAPQQRRKQEGRPGHSAGRYDWIKGVDKGVCQNRVDATSSTDFRDVHPSSAEIHCRFGNQNNRAKQQSQGWHLGCPSVGSGLPPLEWTFGGPMCEANWWWRSPWVLVQMAELSAEAVHHVVRIACHQPLQARIPARPFLVASYAYQAGLAKN